MVGAIAVSALGQTISWIRQFGTSSGDLARGMAVEATGVYVVGVTGGVFPGQAFAGHYDAFVRKYDLSGNVLWTRQFGTSAYEETTGLAADATGVYVAGLTFGVLPGQTSAGYQDAFLRKYDASGNVLWTRQFGMSRSDAARGVAVDGSAVYVVGYIEGPASSITGSGDTFVRKYDISGTEIWTRHFGSSSHNLPQGVAVDTTGVYVAGWTNGVLPGQTSSGREDAFVRKYDTNGNVLWTRQFGTPLADVAMGVAADGAGVYVVGGSAGMAYVRKYDPNGNVLWTRQFVTPSFAEGVGVGVQASGIYVAGLTDSTLPGQTSAGDYDSFVARITEVLTVTIDIKPGSDPNSINPKSRGTIPVAILSSSTFDAFASVDTTSLTFGRTGNENSLAFCNGSPGDVNGDGLLDLMCHFDTQKTGFLAGDTLGKLKGKTVTGTPIAGSDSVRIVP